MNLATAQKQKSSPAVMPLRVKQKNVVKNIIQPKLKIGAANDKHEREADQVADQVMRMPDPAARDNSQPIVSTAQSTKVQRMCQNCRDEELVQRKSSHTATPEVTPAVGANIRSLQGGGRPLSKSEKSFFEPRFGTDFSQVRLHEGGKAAETAKSIQARAFTLGNHVALGNGEYASGSASGKKLLAHELTHVVQQKTIDEPNQNYEIANIARYPHTNLIQRDYYTDEAIDALQYQVPSLLSSINLRLSKEDMKSRLTIRVKSLLIAYLTTNSQQAINQFGTDMSTSSGGTIALDIATKIMKLIPVPQVQFAAKVIDLAKKIFEALPDSLTNPSNTLLSLPSFLNAARLSIVDRNEEVQHEEGPIFENIRDSVDSIDETNYRERLFLLQDLARALVSYPSYQDHQKELVNAWINSSSDSYDIDSNAGCIYYTIWYRRNDNEWADNGGRAEDGDSLVELFSRIGTNYIFDEGEAYFDDISRPEGVKNALIHAYGSNTRLNLLPFPFDLTITERVDTERTVSNGWGGFENETTSAMTPYSYLKPARGNFEFRGFSWRESRGNVLLRMFLRSGLMPKVGDLTDET